MTKMTETENQKISTTAQPLAPCWWVRYMSQTHSHRTMTTSPQAHEYAALRRDLGFVIEPRTKDVQPVGTSDTPIIRLQNGKHASVLRSTKKHLNHHPKVRRNNEDKTWATVYGDKAYASKAQLDNSQSPRWIGVEAPRTVKVRHIYR